MGLIPKIKVNKYPPNNWYNEKNKQHEQGWAPILGLELTVTGGLGIGIGVGRTDFWVGWPKKKENLHSAECLDIHPDWMTQN